MSIESAREFLDKLDNDPKLRDQVKPAMANVWKIAGDNGFDVTAKEVAEALYERHKKIVAVDTHTCLSEPPTF